MRCWILIAFLCYPILSSPSPLCLLLNPDDFQGCPCGWVHREGKCYKLFTDLKTFDEAEAACKSYNSHLTSVTSKPEHDFLLDYIMREVAELDLKYVWIGGRRKRTRYIWTDLQPFLYADWHGAHTVYSDLVKHPTHDCVQFVTTAGHYTGDPAFGTFVNHPCTGKDNFICQRPVITSIREGKQMEYRAERRYLTS